MRRLLAVGILAGCVVSGAAVAHATTIYSQTYVYNANQNGVTSDSSSSSTVPNQRMADNFQIATSSTVGSLEWYGYYALTDPFPSGGSAPFFIAFHQSVSGTGAPLVPAAYSATVTASIALEGGPVSGGIGTMYRFSATLPTEFPVSANAQYWLAINATQASPTDKPFHWATAQNGLPLFGYSGDAGATWGAYSDGGGAGGNGRNYEAFTLFAPAAVPEPSTCILGCTALGIGGWRMWRRSRRSMRLVTARG